MPSEPFVDLTALDFSRVIADRAGVAAVNPQQFEMQQLDAIVLLDAARQLAIGYKDVRGDEFWARGHFPGNPVQPGVITCEAAAQVCSYYVLTQHVLDDGQVMGFGGLDEVRFRGVIRPGDRLVMLARGRKLSRRMSVFDTQGFVGGKLVFEGTVTGVPLPRGVV